jgi:hypothetical protein
MAAQLASTMAIRAICTNPLSVIPHASAIRLTAIKRIDRRNNIHTKRYETILVKGKVDRTHCFDNASSMDLDIHAVFSKRIEKKAVALGYARKYVRFGRRRYRSARFVVSALQFLQRIIKLQQMETQKQTSPFNILFKIMRKQNAHSVSHGRWRFQGIRLSADYIYLLRQR